MMRRCFFLGLVWAIFSTLLVVEGSELARASLLQLNAVAAAPTDDVTAPPCCEAGASYACETGCTPAEIDPPGRDRIVEGHPRTRLEEPEHLDGRRPTPDLMPPEAARARF